MNASLVEQLVQARGIESEYTDAWGTRAVIKQESKEKILAAMGYPVHDEAALIEKVNDEAEQSWLCVVEPVTVVRTGSVTRLLFKLPIDFANDPLVLKISQGNRVIQEFEFVAVEQELIAAVEIRDVEIQQYAFEFNEELDMGYYKIELFEKGVEEALGEGKLIVAPQECYKQQALIQGKKMWGPSIQLYCVRSARNWGVGDFNDLKVLIDKVADRGADFVGLNPIHALYPNNADACSPYSPSSRRWLNVIYIDVQSVVGFNESKDVQKLVASDDFIAQLNLAKQTNDVDYGSVMDLKLKALKPLYSFFVANEVSKNTKTAKAFADFKLLGGDSLKQMATFDAIQDSFKAEGKFIGDNWGWPVWPEGFRDYDSEDVKSFAKAHSDLVDFYMYLQFVAAQQLEDVDQLAKAKGMAIGTYRDLAVGVSEGSTEIWANKDLYRTDASVGAPPDVLGPLGQNWGLPPMDPVRLYQQAYQPIIDLFRANMHACGALRIDHVMALLRLWWVPAGESAKEGTYVYYPVDDLLAILALESHLNKCSIIGEDLGTVPDNIVGKLKENGIHSYKVFFFEQAEDGGFYSPKHYVEQAMATLTTHDMPTLIGYWHCKDLELGQQLGLYEGEELIKNLYADRIHAKQCILDSLHGHNSLPEEIGKDANEVPMTQALNYGMQIHMAKGASALLSLQLEDWLQMDMPVNIPGTSSEYPNWRRKLSTNLEDIFSINEINHLTNELTKARQSAS
ncbi:4-alpha-glucanotransferase [Psychrosphaera sp. 1_MG-2023]|uniref:4-alpha-glucanotransferase n=1 Tax=Psychrosphaera sp. 1_MG-2023 TaxID=3062643 RepID=UPI0026E45283|nr:4-alpha-glucanotransferase [Psychrosphaera sp. 1_MG-2023]MDO6717885.1 4-alpha-glucanotransferase [Psychrosphaera sp. 1_MG-2023]